MDLRELIDSQFGVLTSYRINPVNATVAVNVTRILGINPNRLGFTIMNMGANDVYVSPVVTVAVGNGILLQPSGGGVSFIWNEDFNIVGLDFYAIADGGNSNIYLQEIVSYQ